MEESREKEEEQLIRRAAERQTRELTALGLGHLSAEQLIAWQQDEIFTSEMATTE